MSMFLELVSPSMIQGLILSLVAIGIMIPFKILNFPDITAEGSYPLGGALCAALIIENVHPGVATIIACIAAGIIGVCTACLNLRFKVNTLLAGIVISTMIYSVNLKIMDKPNIALLGIENLFSNITDNIPAQILTLLGLNVIIIIPIFLFFKTSIGLRMRTVGTDHKFAERQAININKYTILGLFIGNALCGLSSSIMVQIQGYADISMGIGIVVHALAALMIGEVIINPNNITKQIISPFIGAIIYQQIQGVAIAIGFASSDLKFLAGSIVLFAFVLKRRVEI